MRFKFRLTPRMRSILEKFDLHEGGHNDFDDGHCAMELVSYMANEPFSDEPKCAHPMLTSLVIGWNDELNTDEERNFWLKPLLPYVMGTRVEGSPMTIGWVNLELEYMISDWLVHKLLPTLLKGSPTKPRRLRQLRSITDEKSLRQALVIVGDINELLLSERGLDWVWDSANQHDGQCFLSQIIAEARNVSLRQPLSDLLAMTSEMQVDAATQKKLFVSLQKLIKRMNKVCKLAQAGVSQSCIRKQVA